MKDWKRLSSSFMTYSCEIIKFFLNNLDFRFGIDLWGQGQTSDGDQHRVGRREEEERRFTGWQVYDKTTGWQTKQFTGFMISKTKEKKTNIFWD